MTEPTVVRLGDIALTLTDVVRQQHARGRILPLLREAAIEAFLLAEARSMGLSVGADELQRAADAFRRRRGLHTAEQTTHWLRRHRLSVDDFEAGLATSVLIEKLRRLVGDKAAAERFAARPADFDRMHLRVVVAPTEDLAREVLSQVRDQGADLGDLARRHSTHPSARAGGRIGLYRFRLPEPLRDASAAAGTLAGPVARPHGFLVVRVEQIDPAVFDEATLGFLSRRCYLDWLKGKVAEAAFSTPLLDRPA